MIFGIWTAGDDTENPSVRTFISEWSSIDPETRLFSACDIYNGIQIIAPSYLPVVSALRIPAALSDVGRLLLLYQHGGFYFDMHILPNNRAAVPQCFAPLESHEIVLFDIAHRHAFDGDIHMMNGVLGARKGSPLVLEMLLLVLDNLCQHHAKESDSHGSAKYSIYMLTGAGALSGLLIDRARRPYELKSHLAGRACLMTYNGTEAQRPFTLYKNYEYHKNAPGAHWSERQKVERLFFDNCDLCSPSDDVDDVGQVIQGRSAPQ